MTKNKNPSISLFSSASSFLAAAGTDGQTDGRRHVGQERPEGRTGAQEAAPGPDQRGEEEEGGGEEEEGGKEESE